MIHATCQRCGARPAAVVVASGGRDEALCLECAGTAAAEWRRGTGIDAARFHSLLAGSPSPGPALAGVAADAACPSCGLLFGELLAGGLAGCPACYDAFAPALPAAVGIPVEEW